MKIVCLLGLYVLFFTSVQQVRTQEADSEDYYEDQPQNCSTTEGISRGQVSYSQAGAPGSVLTFHCGAGKYPFPVSHRLCGEDGEWSTMRLANGRRVSRATCKDVLCPAQLQLENGEFWPQVQWLSPGETQTFSCRQGITLTGSAQRNCTLSGQWTGSTPVCDNQDDDCRDPGVPPGALRFAGRFRTGEKVRYHCQSGLDLVGSAERVCLEEREWSGTEPRCQAPFAFDPPEAVAEAMGGSLSAVMDVFSPEHKKKEQKGFGRVLRIADGRMNIFILLDSSGSIKKQFEEARAAVVTLIQKLDSYEVEMRFHVTSYASKAKNIVSIDDDWSNDADGVIESLSEFDYHSHGKQSGTNLYAALDSVYKDMVNLNMTKHNLFKQTQNVILIVTDGFSNTGLSPLAKLNQIRSLLGYHTASQDHQDEDMLDVYVFGVFGDKGQVNVNELNSIASQKTDKHFFILSDSNSLREAFNTMISDESVTMCGVAQEDASRTAYTRPWHVDVVTMTGSREESCLGSIVTQNWVLTAAHCFLNAVQEGLDPQKVTVQHGEGSVKAALVRLHPLFNVSALRHRNVSEFYDYDVALVKVGKSIPLSWKARPICLPCTKPASRAMKMSPQSTCQQHKSALLSREDTTAYFIHKDKDERAHRKETHIQSGSRRPDCVKQAGRTLTQPTDVTLEEYVPERFLCTGGSSSYQDAASCKGDSGGSLFLTKRMRNFQVGVVSWGTVDVCTSRKTSNQNARDFHISLFDLMPWLRQHLGNEVDFLPTDG